MNSGERCVDAQKAAFLNQLIRKETRAQLALPPAPQTKGKANPVAPSFVFQQTYSVSSGNPASSDASRRRKQQLGLGALPPPARAHLSSASAFSSFDFGAQPSRAASQAYGHFYNTGQAAHLPLRVQKLYGGAAMAGLAMAVEGGEARRAENRVPDDTARSLRVGPAGAAASPHLAAGGDPSLLQLMEGSGALSARRAMLLAQLAAVSQQIEASAERRRVLNRSTRP
jgi:hypothetical protein